MSSRLALIVLAALLLSLAATTYANPVPVQCKRSDNTTYGSTVLAYGGIEVRAPAKQELGYTYTVSPFSGGYSFSWNPGLWHFFYRYYVVSVSWAPGSSQDAWFYLRSAVFNMSYNSTLLNPNPYYAPPPWGASRRAGNQSFSWPDGWGWTGTGPEYQELKTLVKASGATASLSLRQLSIELQLYGGQSGAAVLPGYSIWFNVQCYNQTGGGGQPPPSPGVALTTSVSGCAVIDPSPGTYSYPQGSTVTVRGRAQSGAQWQGMYIRPAGGGSWSWLSCTWQDGWCTATVTMDRSYEVQAGASCPPQSVKTELNFTAPYFIVANVTVTDPEGNVLRTLWPLDPAGWLRGYERSIPNPTQHGQCFSRTWSVVLRPLDAPRFNFTIYRYWSDGSLDGVAGSLLGTTLTARVEMGKCGLGTWSGLVVYAYASFTFSNGTHSISTCADTRWWGGCRFYAFKDRVHVAPLPTNYTLTLQLYRVTASGSTQLPANGTRVRIDGREYVADASGRVRVSLLSGPHTVEVLETPYGAQRPGGYWRRYRFHSWGDGSTANPRTVSLQSNTTLVAYVWDERAVVVRWQPYDSGGGWGVRNATSGAPIAYDSVTWVPLGRTVSLLASEGGGAIFTYWALGFETCDCRPYSGSPLLTLTVNQGVLAVAVFRLAATNQTMFPPGAMIPNPVVFVPGTTQGGEEHMGKRGWWTLSVTHVVTGKTSPQEAGIPDEKAWVWALLAHANGSSTWAPLTGTWRLNMTRDWDPSRRVRDLPGGVKIMEWNRSTIADFPRVVEPRQYAGWHLIALSAWRLQFEELGQGYDTAGVWLGNGTTLALYNVSFAYMGVDGSRVERVYWQPVAVSTFALRAEAVYTLSSHDAVLGRRQILMSIYVNLSWKYLPPAGWQLLGFRVHAPQLGFAATLEEPGCTGASCTGYQGSPTAAGQAWRLYAISLGDTENFYSSPYPRGLLGADGYSSARSFRVAVRWLGAANQPSSLVWGSDKVSFDLAPATVYRLDWTSPKGPFMLTFGCFAQGPSGLTPTASYAADVTFDWGSTGPTHPLKGTQTFKGVKPGDTLRTESLPLTADDWIAFYPIPAGGRYAIAPGTTVPVPLVAKYPPRSQS